MISAVAAFAATAILPAKTAGTLSGEDRLFTPVRKTELRAQSFPLLVSDSYFSVWSPFDRLYDGPTSHWFETIRPLAGAVRVDGEVYRFMGASEDGFFGNAAEQLSVDVLPTQTYYTFRCGPVELDVVFTAPLLIDDLDLMSTPINYISYRVRSLDKASHDVQFYVDTAPVLAVHEPGQDTETRSMSRGGLDYAYSGTLEQPYVVRSGDYTGIDWGYVYLAGRSGASASTVIGKSDEVRSSFEDTGKFSGMLPEVIVDRDTAYTAVLAYCHDLGQVDKAGKHGFFMAGYDDVYCMEYMYELYMAYWKHEGEVSIYDAFERFQRDYLQIMERCRDFDEKIMMDAEAAGGRKYAELLAFSYRPAIAAHKLFTDKKGNLLFFSKENGSNGSVNTVDLTYPSAPLFLLYNTDLLKGMMTSIFEYSESGRWAKPFPAHDIGKYPKANGQTYPEDMPVEEAGNMVILSAAIAKAEGTPEYAARWWSLLSQWTDYLVEYGLDPENQLCTDDFAGHWAHNANLSVKAIMGVAAYSELARMQGMEDTADRYMAKAREMASAWIEKADDGDHYRLAFDRPDTWSLKYNIVWDKLWGTGVFPEDVMEKEIPYYLANQNRYGVPLDCREDYTKSDWIMWIAAMAPDRETFDMLVNPVYDYVNESPRRFPMGDWYGTVDCMPIQFRARSVIAGHWMPVLMMKSR